MSEDKKERIDRELKELLEELRVAIPGAEILFAFLLGVAFTSRFESATPLQKNVYFATLIVTAAAIAMLIAPSALHRLRFRNGDKEQMVFSASHMAVASLLLVLLAVSGAVFLVASLVYSLTAAALAGGLTAAWFVWFWFLLASLPRFRDR